MNTATPSSIDAIGFVAYRLLMNGGRIDKTFLSDVGAALWTLDDDYDVEAPADGALPVSASPAQPNAVEAPTPEIPVPQPVRLVGAGLLGRKVEFVL